MAVETGVSMERGRRPPTGARGVPKFQPTTRGAFRNLGDPPPLASVPPCLASRSGAKKTLLENLTADNSNTSQQNLKLFLDD